ncbi:MAG TPA: radical SAM protein [Candidatus Limnocylindrales bacterium]|nr:radical SAM protein [Candidatus Limnocylindrales bacterium]
MRLLLISPTHYDRSGALLKTTRYWTSGTTLPYLKAITPPGWDVTMVDELFADVPGLPNGTAQPDVRFDVVGITAMGPQIKRAYDLADRFRELGSKVVLGGTWVTLAPEESLRHADAIVAGEAELVWASLLEDLAAGRSRGVYKSEGWFDLAKMPVIDHRELPLLKWDAFRSSWLYRMYFHWPITFSRGCPHPCEYCAVQTFYKRSFRTRPVEQVIDEIKRIKSLGADRLLFLDDNPVAHPEKAKELFRAMIPLKMKWASQSTINIARDDELLDLAARSGCVSLSIGLESLDESSLASVSKSFNKPSRFVGDLAKIRRAGIQVIALLMIGLDGDTTATFGRSLDFLVRNRISFLKLFTPCPYPGTKYYDDMLAEGRILESDWGRYDYGSAIVRPTHMTSEEMLEGFQSVYREFYSVPSILRRLVPPKGRRSLETAAYLVANLKVNRYLQSHPDAWGTIS